MRRPEYVDSGRAAIDPDQLPTRIGRLCLGLYDVETTMRNPVPDKKRKKKKMEHRKDCPARKMKQCTDFDYCPYCTPLEQALRASAKLVGAT